MIISTRKKIKKSEFIFFHTGRSAFKYLLDELKPSKIYIPNLICPDLIKVIIKSKIVFDFYSIKIDLESSDEINLDENEYILIINYFGRKNSLVKKHPRKNVLLDQSHILNAFFDTKEYQVFGSLRKVYPQSDGGFSRIFSPVKYLNRTNQLSYSNMNSSNLMEVRENEKYCTDSYIDMSSSAMYEFLNFDQTKHRERIKTNFKLLNEISNSCIEYDLDFESPAYFVIKFDSEKVRDDSQIYLAKKGIFAAVHWMVDSELKEVLGDRFIQSDFSRLTLSLPLHYKTNSPEMSNLLKSLNEMINCIK